jgi:hypothetical protein
MTEISDETLETLRDLQEQIQRAQQRQQLILQTVLAEHGLDPDTHEVRLQEGVIREVEK